MSTAAPPYVFPAWAAKRDVRVLIGTAFVSASAVAGLAWRFDADILFLGSVLAAIGALSTLAPEFLLALFLVTGAIKEASWLTSLPADLTVLAAIGVFLAIATNLASRGVPPIPRATLLMLTLTSLIVASVLWAPDPVAALDQALRFEALTLLAFLAPIALVRTPSDFRMLQISLVGLGLLIAMTAVPTRDVNKPLTVPGGIEIELGLDVGLALIACAGYLVVEDRFPLVLLWLVAIGVLAFTVVASGSRGALVAGTAALAYVFARRFTVDRAARVRILGITLLAALLVGLSGTDFAGRAAEKYAQTLFSSDASSVFGLRQYLFERGWDLALEHPFGLGAAGFQAVTGLNHPHNILLQLADEQGFIAVALFVALTVTAWRARMLPGTHPRRAEAIVCGGLIVFFLLEALASLDINQNKPLWFSLGLAFAVHQMKSVPTNQGKNA